MNKQAKLIKNFRISQRLIQGLFRPILIYSLCLSLALSGIGPWLSIPAAAAPAKPADASVDHLFDADFDSALTFESKWGQLDVLPKGQPRGALAADRFLLLEQSVLPKEVPVVSQFPGQILRLQKLATLILRVEKLLANLDQGRIPEKTFEDLEVIPALSAETLKQQTMDYIENERRADTPYFVWIRRRDRDKLEEVRAQLDLLYRSWQQNRSEQVKNYSEAPVVRRARGVNWWDVSVKISAQSTTLKTMALADTARLRSLSGRDPYFCSQDSCTFDLTYKGETLHKFAIPVRMVGTYGQFLIFTHKDSYVPETGEQYLSFIDLETYSTSIGNEDLPVFRMPIKTDRPVEQLTIQNGKLIFNGDHWVDDQILQDASDLQQKAFNLTASLSDPAQWASTLPMVDAFREQVRKMIALSVDDSISEHQGLKKTEVLFSKLGKELQAQLEKNAQAQSHDVKLSKEQMEEAKSRVIFESMVKTVETYHKHVSDSKILSDRVQKIADNVGEARKLKGRVNLLANHMLSPKPWASQRVKEALGIYVAKRGDLFPSKRNGLSALMDRPFLNSGVIAAGLMATFMPDTFHQMVAGGLSVGSAALDYTMFALRGIGEAFTVGTARTFAALYEPAKSVGEQYIFDGNWYRTLIGLGTFVPFLLSIYYIPHFLFNYNKYLTDIRTGKAKNFVEQQKLMKKEYYQRLAEEEGRRHTGQNVHLTTEDQIEIDQWLKDRKSGQHQTRKTGWFSKFFSNQSSKKDSQLIVEAAIEQQIQTQVEVVKAGGLSASVREMAVEAKDVIKGFWGLTRQLVFSPRDASPVEAEEPGKPKLKERVSAAFSFGFAMPSYETTLFRWATFWNWYAGWRFCSVGFKMVRVCQTNIPWMIVPKPVMWSARILYPDLFSTVVAKRNGKLVIPTELNGGFRQRGVSDFVGIFSNLAAEKVRARLAGTTTQQIEALKKFEDKIVDVEAEVVKVAFSESIAALAKFATNKKDLEIIFSSKPISSITHPQIREMSAASQNFLRSYFESIYEKSMERYMGELIVAEQGRVTNMGTQNQLELFENQNINEQIEIEKNQKSIRGEISELNLKELKKLALEVSGGEVAAYDLEKAKSIASQVAADPSHRELALEAVRRGRLSIRNLSLRTKYNSVANLDPEQNPSMARWNSVHNRLKSPGALGRAVRSEVSKLLVTLPLDLTMKLFLAAGIFEGVLKPIQEEMFGPNSVFYLSATSFYMLTASGFAMGMMADAWMKVQMDQRQDDMGEFGQIPKGEDAVKSLSRWYFKNFFASSNTLWQNYVFNNKIVFWNLPAALFNISLFYFLFSGRVDISLLVAGYAVSFATPLMAFHTKLDQAFERAVHFAARGLKKEEWLADPKVQEVILKEQQRMRNRFTFWHDFFTGVEGNWTTNVEMIPTSLGTRGFARALFGGKLLEEYVVENILDPAKSLTANVPGLNKTVKVLANACESLLTRGNEDLVIRKGK